jgi:hypothetical protein
MASNYDTERYGFWPTRILRYGNDDTARYDNVDTRGSPPFLPYPLPYRRHDTRGGFNPLSSCHLVDRIAVSSLKPNFLDTECVNH